jgi:hypothetical protein
VFEIRFGYHVGIFISVLLGLGTISGIVTLFATISALDCFQMVAVVVVIASSNPSFAASSATSTAAIALAPANTTNIVVVCISLIVFLHLSSFNFPGILPAIIAMICFC